MKADPEFRCGFDLSSDKIIVHSARKDVHLIARHRATGEQEFGAGKTRSHTNGLF
jgi:hypothetical protein